MINQNERGVIEGTFYKDSAKRASVVVGRSPFAGLDGTASASTNGENLGPLMAET